MANEVTSQIVFQVNKASTGIIVQTTNSARFDMSGTHNNVTVQDFTTSETAIRKGDIVVTGWVYIKALLTNTADIKIGVKPSATFIECMRIRPGMAFIFYAGANDLYGQAASGTQKADCRLIES